MGNLIDGFLVVYLLLQTWLGWRSGLLWQAASIASLGFGVVLGVALSPALGARLLGGVTRDPFHARIAAFLFIFGLVCLTLRLLATWAETQSENGLGRREQEERRGHDRVLGGIFGALKGSLLAMVLVAAGVSLCPGLLAWDSSRLAPPLARAGARLLPEGAAKEVRDWVATSAVRLRFTREKELSPVEP